MNIRATSFSLLMSLLIIFILTVRIENRILYSRELLVKNFHILEVFTISSTVESIRFSWFLSLWTLQFWPELFMMITTYFSVWDLYVVMRRCEGTSFQLTVPPLEFNCLQSAVFYFYMVINPTVNCWIPGRLLFKTQIFLMAVVDIVELLIGKLVWKHRT